MTINKFEKIQNLCNAVKKKKCSIKITPECFIAMLEQVVDKEEIVNVWQKYHSEATDLNIKEILQRYSIILRKIHDWIIEENDPDAKHYANTATMLVVQTARLCIAEHQRDTFFQILQEYRKRMDYEYNRRLAAEQKVIEYEERLKIVEQDAYKPKEIKQIEFWPKKVANSMTLGEYEKAKKSLLEHLEQKGNTDQKTITAKKLLPTGINKAIIKN